MTKYTIVMDDLEVRNEDLDEAEIPALLDSGFVSAVSSILKVVDGEIRYGVIDWDECIVKEWRVPESGAYQ